VSPVLNADGRPKATAPVIFLSPGRHIPASEQLLWFPAMYKRPQARMRLFCFPYAGGSASTFSAWPELFPPEIEVRAVQLPGRWNRLKEKPFHALGDLLVALGAILSAYLDRPYAFFGHSMGALIAFEMARVLRRSRLPQPSHLFVSSRRAPQICDFDIVPPDLPDEQFIEGIARMSGTPSEVLDNPELMQLLLPTLRADFALCHSYKYLPEPPLSCPITVFGGRDDKESEGERLEGWRTQTTGPCILRRFSGGHFYLHSAKQELSQEIVAGCDTRLNLYYP
jgi:medium-chain acyl-[acyl-carrier-protein] hydrolase